MGERGGSESARDLSRNALDGLRNLLCELQSSVQARVLSARDAASSAEMSTVAAVAATDTLFRVDRIAEDAVLEWFRDCWPPNDPVELVMEGLEEHRSVVFPAGAAPDSIAFKCLIDPVDGTRSFMHDKRSAWVLAGLAPYRGSANRLSDIAVAAMTELPPRKQRLADQLSAVRGGGAQGIVARRANVDTGESRAIRTEPSKARDLEHGFAAFARFFPQAKTLLCEFESALWRRLYGESGPPSIFDDQYMCSGGQLYELLSGRDRMLGDLRPEALAKLGLEDGHAARPYDLCSVLIAEEAGCRISDPFGHPLDPPMDTDSPVSWIGFANETLEAAIRPAFAACYGEFFSKPGGRARRHEATPQST
ncbi:MAG: inositol monophosphatase [Deltaproteobacteria bacterium]|nr:inositol monophosphatase [Deltaproteobacteria bacterium]